MGTAKRPGALFTDKLWNIRPGNEQPYPNKYGRCCSHQLSHTYTVSFPYKHTGSIRNPDKHYCCANQYPGPKRDEDCGSNNCQPQQYSHRQWNVGLRYALERHRNLRQRQYCQRQRSQL